MSPKLKNSVKESFMRYVSSPSSSCSHHHCVVASILDQLTGIVESMVAMFDDLKASWTLLKKNLGMRLRENTSTISDFTVGPYDHHAAWSVPGVGGADPTRGLAGWPQRQSGVLCCYAAVHQHTLQLREPLPALSRCLSHTPQRQGRW